MLIKKCIIINYTRNALWNLVAYITITVDEIVWTECGKL